MRSWRTTLAGLSAILAVATKVLVAGDLNLATDVPSFLAGIGLLFAKDFNVSHTQ